MTRATHARTRRWTLALGVLLAAGSAGGLGGCSRSDGPGLSDPALPTVGAPSAVSATDGASAAPAGATTSPDPGATSSLGLVAGFPTDVVPVLPGATVTASAVRAAGDRVDVSLSGTTTKSSKQVLDFYDRAFDAAGFERTEGRSLAPGTGGRVYARGDDVLVVAVAATGDTRTFSVGGTVGP